MPRPGDHPDHTSALLAEASWLKRFARALAFDDASADDLVQETYGAAFSGRGATGEVRAPRAFLAAIARRLAAKKRRSAARRRAREAARVADDRALGERTAPAADEHAERIDTLRLVLDELRGLPPSQRRVLSLHYLDGLDVAEIAAREGVAPATVRAHVARGLAALRVRLDRRAGGREAWALVLAPWSAPGPGPPAELAPTLPPAPTLASAGALIVTAKWIAALVPAALVAVWFVQQDDAAPVAPAHAPEPAAAEPGERTARSERPADGPGDRARTAGEAERKAVAPPSPPAAPAAREAAAASVAGRAIDSLTGEPVPQLDLLIRDGHGEEQRVLTGADGVFATAEQFPHGALTVVERDDVGSYVSLPREQRVEHPLERDVEVLVGPTFTLLLDAPAAVDPASLVFQFRERPQRSERIPEAKLRSTSPPWIRFGAEVTTLEGGGPFDLWALEPSGLWLGTAEVTRTRGVEPAPLSIELEPRGVIEFRVAEGPTVAQSQIVLPVEGVDVDWHGRVFLSFADEDGVRSGRAKHLAAGRYAWTFGTGPSARGGTASVVPGEVTVVELLAEDLGPTFDAEVLLDVTAVPTVDLEGWMVIVSSADDPTTGFVAAPERVPGKDPARDVGAWRIPIEGAPEGTWTVIPRGHPKGSWQPGTVALRPGSGNPTIVLAERPPEVSVTFRVVSEETGEPIEGFEAARSMNGLDYGFYHPALGSNRRGMHLAAGIEYEFLVRAPGHRMLVLRATANTDGEEIVAKLRRGWSNRVVVLDAETMSAIEGVGVLVDGLEVGTTDADGTFLLQGDGPPSRVELEGPFETVAEPETLQGESKDPLLGWMFVVKRR